MGLIVTGGKLVTGVDKKPQDLAWLVLEEGRIVEVVYPNQREAANLPKSNDHKVVSAQGKFICPGLINAHVHLYLNSGRDPFQDLAHESSWTGLLGAAVRCKRILQAGITTVRDLGAKDRGIVSLREAIDGDLIDGPRLIVCGPAIAMTGGHALDIATTVDGPEEMRKTVRRQLADGVDFIKVFATGGFGKEGELLDAYELDMAEIRSAVETAHAGAKKVAAHAYGNVGIRNAIQAGVDSIEHATFLDEETISWILEKHVYLIPTLSNTYRLSTIGETEGLPVYMVETAKRIFPIMMDRFKAAYEAGVSLAAGTDGGSWFNPHHDLVTELELRKQAGVSNLDLIKMATKSAAECLGIDSEVGTIEKGKRSDLIIVDGDPTQDISALRRIHLVIKGEHVYPVDVTLETQN